MKQLLIALVTGLSILAPLPTFADWAVAQAPGEQPFYQRFRSIEQASQTSLTACRAEYDNCRVVLTGKDGCVAFATSGAKWGVAKAGSRPRAANAAIGCEKFGAGPCRVELEFCGR